MTALRSLRQLVGLGGLFAATSICAQEARVPAGSASAPAAAASAAPAAASSPAARAQAAGRPASGARPAAEAGGQRIEITGGRESDTEQRRRSTAAKIVIGREEIEKFGDASIGEVLRRLPGVTTPGGPGRGGPPRMRGLGSGYTQLLIDGQRITPGLDLNSLPPEQIERIEILRAPTAETGARAIAGTINIIMREGFRRRLNDLRLGFGYENDAITPGLHWTRNDSIGEFIYNVSLSAFKPHRVSRSESETTLALHSDGTVLDRQPATLASDERRSGVSLNGRLQWRLGAASDLLLLTPSVFHSEGRTERSFTREQAVAGAPPPLYDFGDGSTDSRFTNLRLNGQWRQRLGDALRMELSGGAGAWRSASQTLRDEFRNGLATLLRRTDDQARNRERSGTLTAKFSGLAGGGGDAGAAGAALQGPEHSLVGGLELETVSRNESRVLLEDGVQLLTEFGENFQASTLRVALYLQDEWSLNQNWAFHAGLRGEGITTRGDAGDGARPTNRSSVLTPLAHLLWKPDPARRDQVRLSLTRSYRAPGTQSLIARPAINSRFPAGGPNEPTAPDSAGNPDLKPELAVGLDLAFERYLEGGGVLSANLFHRNVSNLMRSVTTLETVSWSPVPRWVARQQNIGDALTQGLELEAKYRLDQLVAEAPRVELRHNLALYRSRVEGVPGPDNRLDQQAKLSANFGADHRLRAAPLTLGGNVNWVPGYRTHLAADRAVTVSGKRVLDAFALWTFSPAAGLRLLASNIAPRDYANRTEFQFDQPIVGTPLVETVNTFGPSYTSWQLRLELKL